MDSSFGPLDACAFLVFAVPIVGKHGDPDTARAIFERLWWYDQVVFDARRRRNLPPEAGPSTLEG
jgi:hypothetical protein